MNILFLFFFFLKYFDFSFWQFGSQTFPQTEAKGALEAQAVCKEKWSIWLWVAQSAWGQPRRTGRTGSPQPTPIHVFILVLSPAIFCCCCCWFLPSSPPSNQKMGALPKSHAAQAGSWSTESCRTVSLLPSLVGSRPGVRPEQSSTTGMDTQPLQEHSSLSWLQSTPALQWILY